MTMTEQSKKSEALRRELAETFADQLLDELPEAYATRLHSKVVELLLSTAGDFNDAAAKAHISEKVAEWVSLPGQQKYRYLLENSLAAAMANDPE